ncbi:hypothetical protein BD414DRAFT_285990 [Trametes punicea]|nr:hypothetical protein BD414DRAFT_285990 [Trametes punicea]
MQRACGCLTHSSHSPLRSRRSSPCERIARPWSRSSGCARQRRQTDVYDGRVSEPESPSSSGPHPHPPHWSKYLNLFCAFITAAGHGNRIETGFDLWCRQWIIFVCQDFVSEVPAAGSMESCRWLGFTAYATMILHPLTRQEGSVIDRQSGIELLCKVTPKANDSQVICTSVPLRRRRRI